MNPTTPQVLRTDRLRLTPLQVADAPEMVGVLSDSDLYVYTGGNPPSLTELEELYRFQVGGSPRPEERWHNWIIRLPDPETAVGLVQATVIGESADIAWIVGIAWQGRGYATEAAAAMRAWLSGQGVGHFTAHVHPEHSASHHVAAAVGLRPTDEIDEDGEVVWSSAAAQGEGSP